MVRLNRQLRLIRRGLTMGVLEVLKRVEQRHRIESVREFKSSEVTSLNDWIDQIRGAQSRDEVLSLVDLFRLGDWTDEERAKLSQVYIRKIERWQESAECSWMIDGRSKVLLERVSRGRTYE